MTMAGVGWLGLLLAVRVPDRGVAAYYVASSARQVDLLRQAGTPGPGPRLPGHGRPPDRAVPALRIAGDVPAAAPRGSRPLFRYPAGWTRRKSSWRRSPNTAVKNSAGVSGFVRAGGRPIPGGRGPLAPTLSAVGSALRKFMNYCSAALQHPPLQPMRQLARRPARRLRLPPLLSQTPARPVPATLAPTRRRRPSVQHGAAA